MWRFIGPCILAAIFSGSSLAQEAAIGVHVQTISESRDYFESKAIPIPAQGLVVDSVTPGGPAWKIGLRSHDSIVLRSGGRTLSTTADFKKWSDALRPGAHVTFAVLRWIPGRRLGDHAAKGNWKRGDASLIAVTPAAIEDARLRVSYVKIDGKWMEIPESINNARDVGDLDVLKVGRVGTLAGCRVLQVTGADNAIIEVASAHGALIRMAHLATAGMTDGQVMAFHDPIAVIGTWTYQTTLQSDRTIFLGVALKEIQKGLSDTDLKDLKKHLAD